MEEAEKGEDKGLARALSYKHLLERRRPTAALHHHSSPQSTNWTLACPTQVMKAKAQAETLWCQDRA